MGRKKIRIESIENERQKMVTFSRRRAGLIKKAHELAVLCDCKIALLIFDRTDNCHLYSSDQQAEDLLKKYQERDHVEKRKMTECYTEDCDESDDESMRPASLSTTEQQAAATAMVSPAKGTGVMEYVVDQKGAGSESLVVKSAATKGTATTGQNASPTRMQCRETREQGRVSSRRNSTSSPLKTREARETRETREMGSYRNSPALTMAAVPTTQSHHLFPNYVRGTTSNLPSLDSQLDLVAMNTDIGLAALNASDFNLNTDIWNTQLNPFLVDSPTNSAALFYDTGASDGHSIPRYHTNYKMTMTPTSRNMRMSIDQNMPSVSTVYGADPGGINNIVSDLFGDMNIFY